MLLQISNINKAFGDNELLKNCSLHIEEKEKCALVGNNGTGKTTLLKIITGLIPKDGGTVTLKSGATVGYLSQLDAVSSENTILKELTLSKQDILDEEEEIKELSLKMNGLSGDELNKAMDRYAALQHDFEIKNGYAVRSEITGVLKGLGFSEEEGGRVCDHLSGGQKTRVALGKILLTRPDLIILDEPTNHLDISSIEWLEGFLRSYHGAVLLVSHDRFFLDRVVTKVFALEEGTVRTYDGNYTIFSEKQKALRDARIKAYLNQQEEIKHQEEVISKLKQFNREKSIKRAESREKLLSRMDRLERPEEEREISIRITPSVESGNDVLSVENLSKAFPGNTLFKDISFEIKKGERVALIGMNGTGKTTLLKIINKMEKADSGSFRTGTNVKIGYYDQEHQVLHNEKSLFQEMSDAFPMLNNTKIRNVLASFLFTGDDVFKLIGDLSGGERGRVSLSKLMLSNANFLLLDEPTNHLDTSSKEILEEALNEYTGTVFFVSHDRFFINKTATRILDLKDKEITNYPGNYDYYLEKRVDPVRGPSEEEGNKGNNVRNGEADENALSWAEQKAEQARIRKQQNDIKRIEEEIDRNEKRTAEINELMTDPEIATDAPKLNELTTELSELEEKLRELMNCWESLQAD